MNIISPIIMAIIGITGAIVSWYLCKHLGASTGEIGYGVFYLVCGAASVGLSLGGVIWLIVSLITQ